MKKNITKILLIVASMIIMLGVTSCMETKNNSVSLDSAREAVLAFLTEKYGKEFECVAYSKPSLMENEYTFALVEVGKNYDSDGFKAYYSLDPETGISDGFFSILIRDQIAACVLNTDSERVKVLAMSSKTVFDNRLDSSSDLSDVKNIYESLRVYFYIFVREDAEIDLEQIKATVADGFFSGKIKYYKISEADFNEVSYENVEDILGKIIDGEIVVEAQGETEF